MPEVDPFEFEGKVFGSIDEMAAHYRIAPEIARRWKRMGFKCDLFGNPLDDQGVSKADGESSSGYGTVNYSSIKPGPDHSSQHSPIMPFEYVTPAQGSHRLVADFWSTVFIIHAEAPENLINTFTNLVIDQMRQIGYLREDTILSQPLTFSAGIIGLSRDMVVCSNKNAQAIFYFKRIRDNLYVSLRVVYPQPLSVIKMGVVGLVLLAILLATSSLVFAIGAFVLMCGLSAYSTGDILFFLRTDQQEIFRDDAASIGTFAYLSIVNAADELSLEAIKPPETAPPPPEFGSVRLNRREPRI